MSKPNIVFLDFDGPICNHRASLSVGEDKWGSGMSYLDPIALGLVKRLCEEHNAKIVVSSSWRTDFDLTTMQALLGAACPGLGTFVYADQQYWRTSDHSYLPVPPGHTVRGAEIECWLISYKFKYADYVIIDDDSDVTPCQDNLVRVDPYEGFGFHAYMRAKKKLGDDSGFVDKWDTWIINAEI